MNENQTRPSNLIDTTDCLEAIGVFRGWKNFLFAVVILCLLVVQSGFWLVDLGVIKTPAELDQVETVVVAKPAEQPAKAVAEQVQAEPNTIRQAAEIVTAQAPNQPAQTIAEPQPQKRRVLEIRPRFEHLVMVMRFVNFVLIIAAILYCLTILFTLKVSLLGRLGGINHIARAFFLSLVMLVLLLPWQKFFPGIVAGAMYTPNELLAWLEALEKGGVLSRIAYYLRFCGYWLLLVAVCIFSWLRSVRWAKAILRRLEVI